MLITKQLSVLALCVIPAFAGSAQADERIRLTGNAEEFVSRGAFFTLQHCDIAKMQCGESQLTVKKESTGESNDEKRVTKTLVTKGIEIEAIFPVQTPAKFYLAKLTVTDARWPVLRNLQIGAHRKTVQNELGSPSSSNGDCIKYFLEETQSDVSFCFKSDRISRIVWERWID